MSVLRLFDRRRKSSFSDSGKRTMSIPSDLSACAPFQALGEARVFSIAHMDSRGLMTVLRCEQGEKPWPMWPCLTEAELEEWATNEKTSPDPAPYLPGGALTIQPSGQIHAPYPMDDVLMTGTMH